MKYPDFIIPGFIKCGTSALWHNLHRHPDIYMARKPWSPTSIEFSFWQNSKSPPGAPPNRGRLLTTRGVEWYKSFFPDDVQCCGEKSPVYVMSKPAMRRISKYIPDVKLIVILRDPVERVWSHYNMHRKSRLKNRRFVKARFPTVVQLDKGGRLAPGRYMYYIRKNLLPFFKRKQVLFVISERLKSNTCEEMNKIHKFLGVEPLNWTDVETLTREQRTKQNKDYTADSKVQAYKRWTSPKPKMSAKLVKYTLDYYRVWTRNLEKFLGYKLPEWRH